MHQGVKTATTLTVLSVLLIVAAVWGYTAATQPFPGRVETPVCIDTTVGQGTRVRTDDVTVSVLNASTREGLAGRTMGLLTDEGFAEGETGNAPRGTRVRVAEIWTTDPQSVAVALVGTWMGPNVPVRKVPDPGAPGVVVVVGNEFRDLSPRGRPAIAARAESTFCTPPELSTAE